MRTVVEDLVQQGAVFLRCPRFLDGVTLRDVILLHGNKLKLEAARG